MKCPECGKELEISWQPDTNGYLQGMGKLSSEYKQSRIWQTTENLAETALIDIPSKERTKEKLLALFKYYLKELMQSEGN